MPTTNALFALVILSVALATADELPPTCDSKIYCQGDLLDKIQRGKVFSDDKTFVDLKQKQSPQETLSNFQALMDSTNGSPSQEELQKFVSDNFETGNELEKYDPDDWTEKPARLSVIRDPDLRNWTYHLNYLWKDLSRKISDDVKENPDRYSLIYVPNGFIIPGGRFTEYYYWDTYWIVKGLLICGMKSTSRGIIENFAHLVETLGHIPNGGRVYYLQRSQPPTFVPMVQAYTDFAEPHEAQLLVKKLIGTMDKEFEFWMNERTVVVEKNGKKYTLCRFYAPSSGPRPESYSHDIETAQHATTEEARQKIYHQIKSGAESGWDFSARWFIKDKTNAGNLSDINTGYIIPVDLNSFIYWNAKILQRFHRMLGNEKKANYYKDIAKQFKEAVEAVMWNEDVGCWLDYDVLNNINRKFFYPSNVAPLWTGCYNKEKLRVERIISYLKENKIDHFPGGIPTSLDYTGEQWDFPNAWAPLQAILIQGLDYTEHPKAQKFAYELAKTWVQSNYKSYETDGNMYEKYDASAFGRKGFGGEYEVQTGFGWTNGVIFEFALRYSLELTAKQGNSAYGSQRSRRSKKERHGR